MTRLSLACHPDTSTKAVRRVDVNIERTRKMLNLTYVIEGPTELLEIPAPAKPDWMDGLWRSTCVELFVRGPGSEYYEFNFAPSTEWAAYRFLGRREGMAPLGLDAPPRISASDEGHALIVSVQIEGLGNDPLTVGLSAVVAEKDGTLSYWALNHPPGVPDFHDPACFALELPAAV
jgi:hypothetical protein